MSHRLSVNVTDKVRAILDDVSQREELSITDVINRAVQLYDFVGQQNRKGGQLMIKTGEEIFVVHLA